MTKAGAETLLWMRLSLEAQRDQSGGQGREIREAGTLDQIPDDLAKLSLFKGLDDLAFR